MEETMCHRAKTKPSVTAIRQMAAGRCRARQGSTLLDQLDLISATTAGTLWFSPFPTLLCSLRCCHLTLSFTLSHSCIVVLILPVNPACCRSLFICLSHYSKRILLISPLCLLAASQKQGQTCNPFTAPLSTDSTQIILKDLQPGLGTVKGRGANRRQNAQGTAVRAMEKEGREREMYKGSGAVRTQTEGTCVTVIWVFVTQVAPRGSLSLGTETNWGPCKP